MQNIYYACAGVWGFAFMMIKALFLLGFLFKFQMVILILYENYFEIKGFDEELCKPSDSKSS